MKRYIKSSFGKFDSVKFANELKKNLIELLPKRAHVIVNPQYDVISIDDTRRATVPEERLWKISESQFKKILKRAIENTGCKVYSVPEGDHIAFAAVNSDDWWTCVDFLYIDYENTFEVYIDYNRGNALFEDWYADI